MAVLDIPLEQMTAEEFLTEMARPQASQAHQARLREQLVETHAWMAIPRERHRHRSLDGFSVPCGRRWVGWKAQVTP